MKNTINITLLYFAFVWCGNAQQVNQKVGTNPTLINSSAALEVESTNKGFLPPRMTQMQRNAIPSPATGLIIYCTNCGTNGQLQVYDGTIWTNALSDAATAPVVASIASLNCAGATNSGILISGITASGVSSTIPYTGGNGGTYTAQSIASTGLTGLTASLVAGTLANGSGTLTYTITGTANFQNNSSNFETVNFAISLGGQSCTFTIKVFIPDDAFGEIINGANNHNFVYLPIVGADGKTWLNHNLGAHYSNMNHAGFNPTQQATSISDHLAYGSLFQWGRAADGHELITYTSGTSGTPVNGTTSTLSGTDSPATNLFITSSSGNYDWRTPQNNNLWQGVNGINNPCPTRYRLPTNAEWTALVTAAGIINNVTAAASSLKLTVPGYRISNIGSLGSVGSYGRYWSSSVSGASASLRYFFSGGTDTYPSDRAHGLSVRCLKN